jgi:hypothetical protein
MKRLFLTTSLFLAAASLQAKDLGTFTDNGENSNIRIFLEDNSLVITNIDLKTVGGSRTWQYYLDKNQPTNAKYPIQFIDDLGANTVQVVGESSDVVILNDRINRRTIGLVKVKSCN